MAARVKSTISPALVTWARETAGFTSAEAAKRLKMDEERLAAWEDPASDQAPSIPQLRKLAALFKRPLAVFYLREAPPRLRKTLRRLGNASAPRSASPRNCNFIGGTTMAARGSTLGEIGSKPEAFSFFRRRASPLTRRRASQSPPTCSQ
jgi:transcriptional regulator with XRE-family HTH domain